MIKTLLLVAVLTFSFTQSSFAQRETVNQSAEWFAITSNIKMNKRLSLMAEGQFRFVNNLEPMQFQARTGLDIAITKQLSFMPGYVYSWNPIYGKQPAAFANNEHRIFQQVNFTHRIGRFYFGHRGRLEQRFIEVHANVNGEVVSEGYTLYLNRIRYRIQLQVPLNKKELVPGAFYASFYNEFFMDFGSNVVYTDPDQNRFFAGAGYKVDKNVSFQLGFFEQRLIKLSGTKQENNIGFQAQLIYNIDLSKKDN